MMPVPQSVNPYPAPHTPTPSSGGRLVTVDGRELALVEVAIRAEAFAGIARVVLEQRFVNRFREPLEVTYQVPLPADAAVAGYELRVGERRIIGEIERRAEARERFEQAILEGRTAALLDQERSSVFTQQIGNVPPEAEVVTRLTIDQPLIWIDGGWEWRFPTVVAPRYLGAEGRVADAAAIAVDVADAPLPVRARLELAIRTDEPAQPRSPSHALSVASEAGAVRVGFASEAGARLDRDVVVRWAAAKPAPGAVLDRGGSHGLLTLVPPSVRFTPVPRDLVILLDISGSMEGPPLAQAQRLACALIDTLDERDRLEIIAFANAPRRWSFRPAPGSPANCTDAKRWVTALQAGGGTEMRAGIVEALSPLRAGSERQVVLVSDGHVGFEREIVAEIRDRLARSARVHVIGVGSAVNRSLTRPAARAGAGVEVIVAPDEDIEPALRRIVAGTAAPIVTELEVSGSALAQVARARIPDLLAAAPALVPVALAPNGGELVVRGRSADGVWEQRVSVPATAPGDGNAAFAALFARERVEELELAAAAGRELPAIEREIEQLGLDYRIATRMTSWIAVSETQDVDPRAPTRRQRIPQELPHATSAEGFGLRGAVSPFPVGAVMAPMSAMAPAPAAPPMVRRPGAAFDARSMRARGGRAAPPPPPRQVEDMTLVLEAANELEMPGTVTVQKDGRLVVTIDVTEALSFVPPERAVLVLENGEEQSARVEPTLGTAATSAVGGQVLRVVLVLDAPRSAAVKRVKLGPMLTPRGRFEIVVRIAAAR